MIFVAKSNEYPRSVKCQRGMSLLELLVALAIVAGLTGILAEGVRYAGRVFQKEEALREASLEEMSTHRMLTKWIGRSVTIPQEERTELIGLTGNKSVLKFKTVEPGYPTKAGLYDIVLLIERNLDDNYELIVQRQYEADGLKYRTVLLESDETIEFSYFANIDWQDEWGDPSTPPQLVRLSGTNIPEMIFPVNSKISVGCVDFTDGNYFEMRQSCQG